MSFKVSDGVRFLGALGAAVALLLLLVLRVTSCAPVEKVRKAEPGDVGAPVGVTSSPPPTPASEDCRARGWGPAARANARNLQTLAWAPFGRAETGWETYAPIIQREIGTTCPPDSEGFAAKFAAWQGDQRLLPDGVVSEKDFHRMRGVVQTRRPFVRLSAQGVCPEPSDVVMPAQKAEGYAGKQVWLRPGALHAYRRMVAAAKAEVPEIAADPRNLTIFSGYRSPSEDAARCQREGNCDGLVRARCSAHRTGLALDLYVGQAPGFGPDSTADPNRRFMSRTPTYRWLVRNAERFGFVNYPFEPWHWEWTGEAP